MIDELGLWLVRTLVGFTMAATIVWFLELLPLRTLASHRSWMWRAVYFKTVIWMFCPAWLLGPLDSQLATAIPGAIRDRNTNWFSAYEEPPQAKNRSVAGVPTGRVLVESPEVMSPRSSKTVRVQQAGERGKQAAAGGWPSRWSYVVYVWLVGVGAVASVLIYQYVCTYRMLCRSTQTVPFNLVMVTSKTARQLGIRMPTRVELSDSVKGPMLVMSTRVHLILPADFEARFGLEACRMAIAHELAHYKRHDLWWNVLPTLVSVVFFFWPPAWLAARRYYLAMELACDACAIHHAKLGHVAYAGLLVRLFEDSRNRPLSAHALSMARSVSFHALSERIRFMRIDLQTIRFRRQISTLVMLTSIALIALPWAMADDMEAKKKPAGTKRKSNRAASAESKGVEGQGEQRAVPSTAQPMVGSSSSASLPFGAGGVPAGSNRVNRGRSGGFGGGMVGGSVSSFPHGNAGANAGANAGGFGGGNAGGFGGGNGGGFPGGNAGGGGGVNVQVFPGGGVFGGFPGGNFGAFPGANAGANAGAIAGGSAGGGGTGNGVGIQRTDSGHISGSDRGQSVTSSSSSGVIVSSPNGHVEQSIMRSQENRDGVVISKTQIKQGKTEVGIEESPETGFEVTITEPSRGRPRVRKITAKDLDELQKKNRFAFDLVRQHHINASGTSATPLAPIADGFPGFGDGPSVGSAAGGSAAGGSADAGGGGAAGGGGGGGSFTPLTKEQLDSMAGNARREALKGLQKDIEKSMNEATNPLLREHLRGVLEQMKQLQNPPKP